MSRLGNIAYYHWSPTARRKQISKYGLVPGKWSIDKLWKPPHICFANSADWAWQMSGYFHPEIDSWDLWQVYADDLPKFKALSYNRVGDCIEIRVEERVYKRHVRYVGSRNVS